MKAAWLLEHISGALLSEAARTVPIEVKSGLSKEILEDLIRIQTALE